MNVSIRKFRFETFELVMSQAIWPFTLVVIDSTLCFESFFQCIKKVLEQTVYESTNLCQIKNLYFLIG